MTHPVLARPAREGEPGWRAYGRPDRVYEHPISGEIAPSISAVKDVLDKPALDKHLIKERAREVAEYVADHTSLIVGDRDALISEVLSQSNGYEAPSKDGKPKVKPNVIGDLVHDAIDHHAKNEPSIGDWDKWPITARRMWKQYNAFVDKYNPEYTHSEFTVWSHAHNYAGTADWAARIGDWHVLADSKTGKSTYPEVGLQVAAIDGADTIISPDGTEIPMFKADRYAVLHIRPTYAALIPLYHIGECFQAFLAARLIHRWHFEVAPHVVGEAPRVSVPIREAG